MGKSKLVTLGAILLLLPGFIASLYCVRDIVSLFQGPPPAPEMLNPSWREALEQSATAHRVVNLVIGLVLVLLFVPAGWRVLRRSAYARTHATIVVALVAGLFGFITITTLNAPDRPDDLQAMWIVTGIAGAWVVLVLALIWRPGVAHEFD